MRTDNALNEHLEQRRADLKPKLVYDATTDEMVTEAVMETRRVWRKEHREMLERVRTGAMG